MMRLFKLFRNVPYFFRTKEGSTHFLWSRCVIRSKLRQTHKVGWWGEKRRGSGICHKTREHSQIFPTSHAIFLLKSQGRDYSGCMNVARSYGLCLESRRNLFLCNPTNAKYKKFRPLQILIYLIECDICWKYILTT
jgi:hypothetical protein